MNSLLKELLLASFPCTLSNLSPGRGGGGDFGRITWFLRGTEGGISLREKSIRRGS